MSSRSVLAALAVLVLLATPAGAFANAPDSPYRLDSLRLVFVLDEPAGEAHPVSVQPADGGSEEHLGGIAPHSTQAVFVVSRKQLAADGGLTVRVGGEVLDGWVHLLPRPSEPGAVGDVPDASVLRSRSLAYAPLDDRVRLGLRSHVLDGHVDDAGDLTGLRLDGELLPGARGSTVVPGELALRSSADDRVEWLHDGSNPLRLTIERDGDRIRYSYEYRVVRSIDRAVPVTTRFALPGGFGALESLRWRPWDRVNSNRPPQFRADPDPGDDPLSMSQYPFLAARGGDGAYIGVLDQEGSSLFGRVDEASGTFDVEMWMWPRNVGQTYRWTFEVLAGHEEYANAHLRAVEPHTARNRSSFRGGMKGPLGVVDTEEQARRAYAHGVRAVWLHAWWYRNGLYFLPDQAMDEPYTAIWGETYTYDRLKQKVENGQAAGLKVYVYFQFAGVSEDIMDQFAPSLVRDPAGNTIVAGRDGGGVHPTPTIRNIWANPDPDGLYGRSFLDQVDRLLGVMKPDGIAMDRGDRLDFTYQTGYDYASFDGYASPRLPDAEPMPAASVTRAGVEMYKRLRELMEKHDAELWTNLPTAIPAFTHSDMSKIDQPMTPWSLFLLRAGSNGKPFFVQDRTAQASTPAEQKCEEHMQLARLSRGHPMLGRNVEYADLCPPFPDTYANPRLQYVIPTDDPHPAYWLFEDGTSIFRFDETKVTATERFAGSAFVPLRR